MKKFAIFNQNVFFRVAYIRVDLSTFRHLLLNVYISTEFHTANVGALIHGKPDFNLSNVLIEQQSKMASGPSTSLGSAEKTTLMPQLAKGKVHAAIIKPKIKSHRPIILLRRNSSGNIQPNSATTMGKHVKMPRLKSMTDIELKRPSVLKKASSPKVKVEQIEEYPTLPTPQLPTQPVCNSAMSNHNGSVDVKVEQSHGWPVSEISQQIQTPENCFSVSNQCLPSGNITANHSGQTFIKEDIGENATYFFQNTNSAPFQNTFNGSIRNGNFSVVGNFNNPNQFANQQIFVNNIGQPISNQPHFSGMPFQNLFQPQTVPAYQQQQPLQYFNPNQPMHINTNFNGCPMDDSLTNITWLGRMGVDNFMPVPLELERKYAEQRDRRGRPPYSYMALIQFAINSSSSGRMTLRQIYQWIEEKFPYFKTAKPGWKNSIRHNLSLHDIFVREVAAGSKASYWTLRADLNVRPLTLESLRGGAQHTFSDCTLNKSQQSPQQQQQQQQQLWSVPQTPGQKPLLPRLPHCSKPYVFLPVPILQSSDGPMMSIPTQPPLTPQTPESSAHHVDFDNASQDITGSSSFFADSGFHSDISHTTPSGAMLSQSTPGSSRSVMKPHSTGKELSPTLSQVNNATKSLNQKQSRKEPLKTLNDSLNSSLHFVKQESSEGDSPLPSPRRRPLSPSGAQFLLCKKLSKQSKRSHSQSIASSEDKPTAIGLSEESFTEILNDLGSPFKGIFSQDFPLAKSSPKAPNNRKRRRSWGSPDSSYSGGSTSASAMQVIRNVNETTPMSQQIRRVKSDLGDLAKRGDDKTSVGGVASSVKGQQRHLPTSTPMLKEKWKKSLHYKSCDAGIENQENIPPQLCRGRTNWMENPLRPAPMRTPSPIPSSRSEDLESQFLHDIMGTMFKTPERPIAPARHFDSLSPTRVPFADVTAQQDDVKRMTSSSGEQHFLTTPVKVDVLDSSFSKLLDISGGSGGFSRINNHFSDIADLNLSWSSLTQL